MNSSIKTTSILFIALIITIVFSNSLKNDFAWDDKYLIINNPYIKDCGYISKIATTQLYEGSGSRSNFYRPLQLFSFAIDYSIWKLNPFGYHLTNLLLHIFNSALVYSIAYIISASLPIAFLTALMFGISPAISGVVHYIPARADLLMAFFIFLSIRFFLRHEETRGKTAYLISVTCFILSLLSKEMAMIFPFLLVMESARRHGKKIALKPLLPYFIVLFLYVFLRITLMTPANGFISMDFAATIPLWKRLLTDLNVITAYIGMLLVPFGLHMQRFMPPAGSLLENNVLVSAALVLLTIAAVIKLSGRDKIFSYAALWFFICLAPVLNIYPISVFLHEMWLYLPSLGFYMFISAFIVKVIGWGKNRIAIILLMGLYALYYALTVVSYGKTWHDSVSLFNNDLKYEITSPFRHLLYNNMAMACYDKGEFEKSIEYCKKSMSLNPRYAEAYNNLGIAYAAAGKPVKAIVFLKKAVQLDKNYGAAYCNLGRIYTKRGNIDKAMMFFREACRREEKNYEAHYCMGSLYMIKGDYKEALGEYEKASVPGLNDAGFYNSLAGAYIRNNRFQEAEAALSKSLSLNSRQFEPHNNLGNLYSMAGHFDLAMREYREALRAAPRNEGVTGNINKIKSEWKEALKNAKP
ncbi:MAG: tetratricopeptide repeat protein [Candidatus Omnitrophota bacterium]|jgi:tetratricopeptide (TPR) repeat protein